MHRQTEPLKKQYDVGAFNGCFPIIVEEIGTIETKEKQARVHLKSFWEQQIKEKELIKHMKQDPNYFGQGNYSMMID